MGKTAVVFPGQGAQQVGMGADLVAASPRAARIFAQAGEILGFDVQRLCAEGPAERLESTDVQQAAILVTSVACLEAWRELGETDIDRTALATAGLSLGEYTALYFAGSLSFRDAVRLVRRRGELMQQAAEASPSGMVSLIGADEAKAKSLCSAAAEGEVLVAANLNCPGQIVLSGAKSACARAAARAEEFGMKAVPLKVAGAFHSPFMQPAADGLSKVLAEVEIRPPRIPVLSNVTAAPHADPASIRRSLTEQLTKPVRWQGCMEYLLGHGFDTFVEVGPSRVLSGLMRKINRQARTVSVGTLEAVRDQALLPAS
jgi:[acyl-carrier-protein] S-malonyltransferase